MRQLHICDNFTFIHAQQSGIGVHRQLVSAAFRALPLQIFQ
jgi:hypothetical protein